MSENFIVLDSGAIPNIFAGGGADAWDMLLQGGNNFPWEMADDLIAVRAEAEEGPGVWVDRTLARSVFLSRQLGDALDAAGVREAFRLYRARLI